MATVYNAFKIVLYAKIFKQIPNGQAKSELLINTNGEVVRTIDN